MSQFFKYGWNPDLPDHRDVYKVTKPMARPALVDLVVTKLFPPIWDQEKLGACVAHGTGRCFMYALGKEKLPEWMVSRLMIYYDARIPENSTASDDGCQIRDAIKTLNRYGVCAESEWPYIIDKFAIKPPEQCYIDGLNGQLLSYSRVSQTVQGLETCLAEGYPIVCGISVYESFESDAVAATGMVPMPSHNEGFLGGHCITIVGYDNKKQLFKCANSWGISWGQQGYFFIPYAYLLSSSLADDFWQLQKVE